MSQQLPSSQDVANAQQVILHNVHKQAFFDRLSAYGITPTSEAEELSLLKIGFQLEESGAFEEQDPGDRFGKAANDLGEALGSIPSAGYDDSFYADVAEHLAQSPDIYNAALTLKTAAALGVSS